MKRTSVIAAVILLAVLLASCGVVARSTLGPSEALPERGAVISGQTVDKSSPLSNGGEAIAGGAPSVAPAPDSAQTVQNRLVIRNANLSLVVKDPAAAIDQFSRMAENMGGFVVSSNIYQTAYSTTSSGDARFVNQANLSIRVPADRLNDALAQIKTASLEVRSQTVTGQDVTQEYTDLQSQLTNLQSAEAQLRQIMENATKTTDVLAVFQQLKDIQGQIEVIKGRIQYLDQSSKLSQITMDLMPDVAAEPVKVGPWSPLGTVKAAYRTLIVALQAAADAAIWAAICVLPIAIVLGLPAFFVVRRWLRRRSRKAEAAPTT